MPDGYFDETKVTARPPNLEIEIVRSRWPEGDAERITISLQAAPSFEEFGRFLETTNPFLFWMRFAQTSWAPWLGSGPASLPPGNVTRVPAPPQSAGPNATPDREDAGIRKISHSNGDEE